MGQNLHLLVKKYFSSSIFKHDTLHNIQYNFCYIWLYSVFQSDAIS